MLHRLDEHDTAIFLKALLAEWINPDNREELLKTFGKEAEGEAVEADTFPFTAPGLDIAVKYSCRQGGFTTPRDIQVTLDDLLNRAIDDGRHVLASSYMSQLVGA